MTNTRSTIDKDSQKKKTNKDKAEESRNDAVYCHGELEVYGFFSLLVDQRVIVFLDKPDDERADKVSNRHAYEH